MDLGLSLSWAHRAPTPHLTDLLPLLQKKHTQLHDVPGALFSCHPQLAQGGLDPLALGFQAAAPSHRSGLFCKDALNGVEVPLIFQLAAHI